MLSVKNNPFMWHNVPQRNDIQHNYAQHKGIIFDIEHNDTQHNDIQHNDTQHEVIICDAT